MKILMLVQKYSNVSFSGRRWEEKRHAEWKMFVVFGSKRGFLVCENPIIFTCAMLSPNICYFIVERS